MNYDSHFLTLQLDKYLSPAVLEHSLPDNDKYFMQSGNIETYSAIFFSLLDQMEQFYIQMNSIDELTYVVEPVDISTKHNYRVIKLGKFFALKIFELEFNGELIFFITENRVYMKIKIDPLEPKSITAVFYGPSKSIERYRKMYLDRIDDWNANDDIYRNLLKIFGNFFVFSFLLFVFLKKIILLWISLF